MQDQLFKIELTMDELNMVLGGLGELPAKMVMNIITNIKGQAEKQATEMTRPKPVEAEPVEES